MNNKENIKSKQKTRNVEIKNRQGFTQVSNNMLSDPNMSYKAKGILCHLLSHDQDKFIITSGTLIRHSSDGERSIKSGLNELKKNGYLQITREAGDKGRWKYILNMFGNKFTDIYKTTEWAKSDQSVLASCNIKNTNLKNTNLKKECEEKKGEDEKPLVSVKKEEPKKEEAHTAEIKQFGKTEEFKDSAHTQDIDLPKEFSKEEYELARMLGFNIDEALQPEDPKQLAIRTKQEEINIHYSNEIARVEKEHNLQSDIIIPKLTIESLLEASEDFLGRVGIGFDNNPRRILNLIYNQLPKDFVIKEDSKDVEILGDMIKKYMSSGKDERDSIAKRIYQAVEAMLKIYVIKKYGEPYREVVFPEITRANLVLYLNCNPTFKYCLGGFSNDIDGVYSEVCRLAAKDAKKKVSEIKIEHDKKIRQLEANRIADLQSMFTEQEKLRFQERTNDILNRMDNKPDVSDEPLTRPIKANLTPEESQEMNRLFMVKDPSQEEYNRLNFLIKKSRKV